MALTVTVKAPGGPNADFIVDNEQTVASLVDAAHNHLGMTATLDTRRRPGLELDGENVPLTQTIGASAISDGDTVDLVTAP